ncbi:hypothetical protein EUTSA_v10019586mg, partial [Eutrema salsugineum]
FNRELCKDLFKNWRELDDSLFSVQRVSGGITNILLNVSVKEDTNREVSVTLRLYGLNTEYVITGYQVSLGYRIWCQVAWWIPKWHGAIIHKCTNLNPSDMRQPKVAAEIDKELGKFHEVEIPDSKEPLLAVSTLRSEEPDRPEVL